MEDTDIPSDTCVIKITTKDSLNVVESKIHTSFELYDTATGIALDYRESYGWGTEGFVEFLKHRYRKSWTVALVNSDLDIFLEGR